MEFTAENERKLVAAITTFAESATKLIDALTTLIEHSVGDEVLKRAKAVETLERAKRARTKQD